MPVAQKLAGDDNATLECSGLSGLDEAASLSEIEHR